MYVCICAIITHSHANMSIYTHYMYRLPYLYTVYIVSIENVCRFILYSMVYFVESHAVQQDFLDGLFGRYCKALLTSGPHQLRCVCVTSKVTSAPRCSVLPACVCPHQRRCCSRRLRGCSNLFTWTLTVTHTCDAPGEAQRL